MIRMWFCLWLFCATAFSQELPLLGISHIAFRISAIEKARAFYHGVLGYDEAFDDKTPNGQLSIAYFKVNDNQYVEIINKIVPDRDVLMSHIGFYTDDIKKLHKMMAERGLVVGKIIDGKDGNRRFTIQKPPGIVLEYIEFLQYGPHSWQRQSTGKYLSDHRISTHLLHDGFVVTDFEAARHFWVDQLGFKVMWEYKPDNVRVRLLHLRLPGPSGEYVEIGNPTKPVTGKKQLGVVAHVSLEVSDIQAAYREVQDHGYTENLRPPMYGPDHRWQLNLYDPDGTRVEFMTPIQMNNDTNNAKQ